MKAGCAATCALLTLGGGFAQAKAATFLPEKNTPLTAVEIQNLARGKQIRIDHSGRAVIIIDDMAFDIHELRTYGFIGTPWPEGNVFIAFDHSVSNAHRQQFLEACKVWESVSHVKCVQRTDQQNYALVVQGANPNYCVSSSNVGMLVGQQEISIGSKCWDYKYIIAHEIGHTLGLIHEQSRADRDNFVVINWRNICCNAQSNFDKEAGEEHYGLDYDYASIMHYGRYDFTNAASRPTLSATPGHEAGNKQMGNRSYLPPLDAEGMVKRYGGP